MKINVNQKCTVRLTERGVEAIKKSYGDLDLPPPKEYKAGDEYSTELWEIMNTFGPYMIMGTKPPFELVIILNPLAS